MNDYVFTGLTGSDGLFTFNFFCESIISSLHTLHHVMEDGGRSMPEKVSQLPASLAEIGSNLLEDYGKNQLDLSRFKEELLKFYSLAFEANDEVAPVVAQSDHTLQYYYYVYVQGINLFFPNILESLLRDLPDQKAAAPFLDEISREFAAISAPRR